MSYSFTERIPRESVESYPESEKDIYSGMFAKLIKDSNISSERLSWGSLGFKKYDPKLEIKSRSGRELPSWKERKVYIETFGINMIEFTVSFSECDQCGLSNT